MKQATPSSARSVSPHRGRKIQGDSPWSNLSHGCGPLPLESNGKNGTQEDDAEIGTKDRLVAAFDAQRDVW
jgi:hypothetical protein